MERPKGFRHGCDSRRLSDLILGRLLGAFGPPGFRVKWIALREIVLPTGAMLQSMRGFASCRMKCWSTCGSISTMNNMP
jgi:hypothetical protein